VQGLLDEGVVRREQARTDRAALTLLLPLVSSHQSPLGPPFNSCVNVDYRAALVRSAGLR
jgi:hypothetical protein